MARLFDNALTQYLEIDQAIVAAVPLTLAAWFYSDDITIDQSLLWIGDKDVFNMWFDLIAAGAIGGDPIIAQTRDGGGQRNAFSTVGFGANAWHHACGVFAAANDRRAHIDGGNRGNNVTAATPVAVDRTAIGRDADTGSPGRYASGRIAEAAVWDVALTDAEVAILGAAYSPLFVRPQSLVAYWPLIGRLSPEIDLVGGFDMVLNNAPTQAPHPRIIYPTRQVLSFPPSAAPPVVTGRPTRLYFGPSSVRQVDRSFGGYHG